VRIYGSDRSVHYFEFVPLVLQVKDSIEHATEPEVGVRVSGGGRSAQNEDANPGINGFVGENDLLGRPGEFPRHKLEAEFLIGRIDRSPGRTALKQEVGGSSVADQPEDQFDQDKQQGGRHNGREYAREPQLPSAQSLALSRFSRFALFSPLCQ